MKKGKILYDAVMKSIDTMLPDELREDTKRAVEVCKDAAVGIKDHCESSATLLRCIFKENPKFFFPWKCDLLKLALDDADAHLAEQNKIFFPETRNFLCLKFFPSTGLYFCHLHLCYQCRSISLPENKNVMLVKSFTYWITHISFRITHPQWFPEEKKRNENDVTMMMMWGKWWNVIETTETT